MDIYYLILVVPALILSFIAQGMVQSTFKKYSSKKIERNITGAQAANYLLQKNAVTGVTVKPISGSLTDNFNPTDMTLNLSEPVYNVNSIAAVGVAAHETGHAIQHNKGYLPIKFRSMLVPVANLGSTAGPLLAIAGLSLSFSFLVDIGLILFFGSVLFYLVTLPVEFNASSRALKTLKEAGVMNKEELKGVKKVLGAAAMTYVASALVSLGNFIRFFLLTKRRD
ncbi:MAG: zinc metallopeptidase [Spirochaetaceae bacterium]|nr:zinc metallopeptidase [Spirochaetaceae bacterium]